MAKNKEKVNKGIKAERRAKIILGSVIAVIILIIIAYFVNLSGLIPRMLTGVKITENINGQQQVIETISVAETNYQFSSIAQQYSQYLDVESLDEVMDPTTGKTYRQWLLDQAAEKIKTLVIINRAAEQNNYLEHSNAAAYAQANIDTARSMAELYGYPSLDTYLQAIYGRGMNTQLLRQCIIRDTLAQEYQQYMTQFGFTVTDEEIQAAYDEDPSLYQRVDYCIYYFAGEHLDDGSVDTEQAIENAQAVADSAVDADSFSAAVQELLTEEEAIAAGFITPTPDPEAEEAETEEAALTTEAEETEEEAEPVNPTLHENETAQSIAYGADGLSDFVFSEGENGETTVLTSDYGAYAVLLIDRRLYDEPTVAYRSFTLSNTTRLENGATQEEVDAAYQALIAEANAMIANPMDSLQFADLVKEHSTTSTGIIYGGYASSVVASAFENTQEGTRADQMAAEGAWLFDESRQHGDTYISTSADQRSLTVFYFESGDPGWVDAARTQIISARVATWGAGLNANAPSYLISYDLIEKLT